MFKFYDVDIKRLPGVLLIENHNFKDDRGCIIKSFYEDEFSKHGIHFCLKETLNIVSHKGVLRGIHFQREIPQPKIVNCLFGNVFCVVVNLHNDKNFGSYFSFRLEADECKSVFIPAGYAFGTLALEDSIITCQSGEKNYPEFSDGIYWNDSELDIKWPINELDCEMKISEKDSTLKKLSQIKGLYNE